jgi:hypothetical protein
VISRNYKKCGLTIEQLAKLREFQDGCCFICNCRIHPDRAVYQVVENHCSKMVIDHEGALKTRSETCYVATYATQGSAPWTTGKCLLRKSKLTGFFIGNQIKVVEARASWDTSRFKRMFEDTVEKAVSRANVELDIDSIGETAES